jgi:hypothetical protein
VKYTPEGKIIVQAVRYTQIYSTGGKMRLRYSTPGEEVVAEVDEVAIGIELLRNEDRYDVEVRYSEDNDEYQVIVGDEIVWSVIDS